MKLPKEIEQTKDIEIENKTGKQLNYMQRKAIQATIELAHKSLQKLRTQVKENQKDKDKIIEILETLSKSMDIENEKGETYTRQEYQQLTNEELTTIAWEALKYFSKNLLTKEETEKMFGKE